MKVLHVITGLEQGGAETVLFRVVTASSPSIGHTIISMTGRGALGQRLEACGVTVHALEMPRGRVTVRGVRHLYQLVRRARPDVMQTWMYHADFVGGVIARLTGVRALVWGVRNTSLDPRLASRTTRFIARCCARLSGLLPAAIVSNSVAASRVHIGLGYRADRFTIIPNGYDLNSFAPDAAARRRVRGEWGVINEEWLFGMVSRWDPYKDHFNLMCALKQLMGQGVRFRCALVGGGMDANNGTLTALIHNMGLDERVILAGSRNDIPAVMNALDLHVLSSASEAFPNVVAEAMACGTPCVVTDVGDAPLIVGSTGWVAPPQDPLQLASRIEEALVALANSGRRELSERCRARIVDHFDLRRMVDAYESVWNLAANEARN